MREQSNQHRWRLSLAALGMWSLLSAVGCQVDVGGQTLPSPWYQTDDIQYFAPGPEFKLAREAAAQKAFSRDQALIAEGAVVPGPAPGPIAVPGDAAVPVVPVPVDAVPVVPAPVAPEPGDVDPLPNEAAPEAPEPDAGLDMNFIQ